MNPTAFTAVVKSSAERISGCQTWSGGRNGAVPTAMTILSPAKLCSSELVLTTSRCGSANRATPAKVFTPFRANWCSSTSTSWWSVMCRRFSRSSAPMSFLAR